MLKPPIAPPNRARLCEQLAQASASLDRPVVIVASAPADHAASVQRELALLRAREARRLRLDAVTIHAGCPRHELPSGVPMISLVGRSLLTPIGARKPSLAQRILRALRLA